MYLLGCQADRSLTQNNIPLIRNLNFTETSQEAGEKKLDNNG